MPNEREVPDSVVDFDFEPGEYALICPYPDGQSGRPYFRHAMM
ncbi:hypothetical protein [Rhodohalobacter sp.]